MFYGCAAHSQQIDELETSVQVFPEDLETNFHRSIKFIKQGKFKPKNCSKEKEDYNLTGITIHDPEVHFIVDTSNLLKSNKQLSSGTVISAINLAIQEWTLQEPHVPTFVGQISTIPIEVAFLSDGRNTISWQNLSPFTRDTRAAIHLTVDKKKKDIIEFDIALDRLVPWTVLVSSAVREGSPEGPYNIQNAMANVFGYVLGLGEVTGDDSCALTMYPYVNPSETIKQILGKGDILGIKKLYSINK